jgi:hypothetical protein
MISNASTAWRACMRSYAYSRLAASKGNILAGSSKKMDLLPVNACGTSRLSFTRRNVTSSLSLSASAILWTRSFTVSGSCFVSKACLHSPIVNHVYWLGRVPATLTCWLLSPVHLGSGCVARVQAYRIGVQLREAPAHSDLPLLLHQ